MLSRIYSLFGAAAAVALLLLHSPEAAAQFSIYSGGDIVYHQAVGTPDSVVFSNAVDLGLSVKWAHCNVGANTPGESGDYFAWGETTAKSEYSWDTYKWTEDGGNTFTKYTISGKATLDPEDDAATVNWGGKWRMPTQAELQELTDKCTWTWKSEGEYADGSLAGYLVTGPNGNSIFLPAAGSRWISDLFDLGSYGYYWSSGLDSGYSGLARYLSFSSDSRLADDLNRRYYGMSVRAVLSAAE